MAAEDFMNYVLWYDYDFVWALVDVWKQVSQGFAMTAINTIYVASDRKEPRTSTSICAGGVVML